MACKRHRLFCQKCSLQVTPKHAYTLDLTKWEWTDCRCPGIMWEPIRNDLTCNLSWPQSPQLAEPLWTDPGPKSGISMCELISTLKKNGEKKCRQGIDGSTFSQYPCEQGKSHHYHHNIAQVHITTSTQPFDLYMQPYPWATFEE